MTGNVASTTGTAPRRPAQPSTRRSVKLSGANAVATDHRQRPRDEDEHDRDQRALPREVVELVREDEQAEREEHRQLRDPGEAVVEGVHGLARRAAVAEPIARPAR